MSDPTTQTWLQYTHLDKLYGYLPGLKDALPAIFGIDAARYAAIIASFDARARAAAVSLLTDQAFAAGIDALPFRSGQTVLAVGDSLTDDLQSWAEILRHALDVRRPRHGVHIVNGGLSAHTTAMVLRRWPATLTATRPHWVLCALGGNDVTRVGPEPTKPQVSLAETIANLRALRRIAAAHDAASWVWVTPVPVLEDRVAEFPAFRFGQSSWRNTDIAALAEAIGDLGDPVVDLIATFGTPADPGMQGADGVHPTLDGQTAIARAVVEKLTTGALP